MLRSPLTYACLFVGSMIPGCDRPGESIATSPQNTEAIPAVDENVVRESELKSDAMARSAAADDWYRDVTERSGVEFRHRSGRDANQFTMIETFGAGAALFDFDRDGDLDLWCVGGGAISQTLLIDGVPGRLFRNDGNMSFSDVTEEFGLTDAIDYSHGIAVGDVNGDRYPDVFVTCYGQSRLFLNDKGTRFRDATDSSTVNLQGWHTAACFADLTGDGFVDLYVSGYLNWRPNPEERCRDPRSGLRDVCMPGNFPGVPDRLLIGRGDGTFHDGSEAAGLSLEGKGLGAVIADFDGDRLLDVYVANDVVRNHLYRGRGNGRFDEIAISAGVSGNEFAAPEGSMGVAVDDFDRDGDPDLFVTNYEFEDNALYRNEGGGAFAHATIPYGLAGSCKPFVGFGTVFLDADSDGWADLLLVNGHVAYRNRQSAYEQPAVLFRNDRGRRFHDISSQAGPWFSVPHAGRGAAVGDLNNDGAPDVVVTVQDGPVVILENLRPPTNWIGLELIGTDSGTDAVGAVARLTRPTGVLSRTIYGGGSYLSYSDRRIVFPLNDQEDDVVEITVEWPSRRVDHFPTLATRSYHQLEEGTGEPSPGLDNSAESP